MGNVGTYNGKYPDGSKSYGGYADYCRAPAHFAVKIPDGISSAEAAPMMCGGVTVWSPLVKNGAGPGKRVGIVGVGGLGHFGLLWAKALGCDEVVAISRTNSKKEDAIKMGATKFIATEEEGWSKANSRSLDLIVSTVSSPNMPIAQYFQLLRTNGQFIQVSGKPLLEDRQPRLTSPDRLERQRIRYPASFVNLFLFFVPGRFTSPSGPRGCLRGCFQLAPSSLLPPKNPLMLTCCRMPLP